MLPSNYTPVYGLGHAFYGLNPNNLYVSTGVKPKNTLTIETILWTYDESYEHLFGARDTNSTTSTGSLYVSNLSGTNNGTTWFGWNNGRTSMGSLFADTNTSGKSFVRVDKNECVINKNNRIVSETSRTSATFTGTQNIYFLALNNGGSVSASNNDSASCIIYTFRIYDNGTLIRDYIPCYDGTRYGFYDTVNQTFSQVSSSFIPVMYTLDLTSNGNGSAYAYVDNVGYVDKVIVPYANSSGVDYPAIKITARPNDGYVFLKWKENGVDYSFEQTIDYINKANTTMEAVFVKKTDQQAKTGFKLMSLEYGGKTPFFHEVISANISEDATSRSTSTIVLKNASSNLLNVPVFLFDPRGKNIYNGIVKAIEGNTITCREAISLFDMDFQFAPVTANTDSIIYHAQNCMYRVANQGYMSNSINVYGYGLERLNKSYSVMAQNQNTDEFSVDPQKNISSSVPLKAEASIENLEEYLFSLFNDFGVYIRTNIYDSSGKTMRFIATNPKYNETLTFGNNMESIQNLTVDIQDMENTVLIVFNEAMSSVRGQYAVKTDGSINNVTGIYTSTADYVAYTQYKPKLIASDDKLRTIVEQNLNNALYNHKITFDIDLSNKLLTFDDLEMARPVVFYQDNKVYNSMITAREFTISENDDEIRSIRITLGRVRNKLTTKINLKKLK